MKKLFFSVFTLFVVNVTFGQQSTPWPSVSTPNTSQSGFVGIGTKSTTTSTNTPLPNFNLHLHGTTDLVVPNDPIYSGGVNGMIQNESGDESVEQMHTTKSTINLGKTTRLGFTNTTTGMLSTDGTVLRMSDNHFVLHNQETNGILTLRADKAFMDFEGSTGRFWAGGRFATLPNTTPGRFNIIANNENGLYVRTTGNTASHYGLRIQMSNASSNAIEVLNNTQAASSVNFRVKTNGFVYARKYTTTLTNFPDYVFDVNYKLMPLSTLRTYIQTNKHLPNVPTAKQVEAEGADLGELNRVLVEKVEELTLYILQLEERLQKLEIQK